MLMLWLTWLAWLAWLASQALLRSELLEGQGHVVEGWYEKVECWVTGCAWYGTIDGGGQVVRKTMVR